MKKQKTILGLLFLFLPVICFGQLLNEKFSCKGYKLIDYKDSSKSYLDESSIKVIKILIRDLYSGEIDIYNESGELLKSYSLRDSKGFKMEGTSLWIFSESIINNIESDNILDVSVYIRQSSGYGILVKSEGNTLEQYYNLKPL